MAIKSYKIVAWLLVIALPIAVYYTWRNARGGCRVQVWGNAVETNCPDGNRIYFWQDGRLQVNTLKEASPSTMPAIPAERPVALPVHPSVQQ